MRQSGLAVELIDKRYFVLPFLHELQDIWQQAGGYGDLQVSETKYELISDADLVFAHGGCGRCVASLKGEQMLRPLTKPDAGAGGVGRIRPVPA